MVLRLHERIDEVFGNRVAPPNPFGMGIALVGLVTGWLIASLGIAVGGHVVAGHHLDRFAQDLIALAGLWMGLVGAVLSARAVFATHLPRPSDGTRRPDAASDGYLRQLRRDFGIAMRPIDLPLGILAGLFSQYLLAPVVEAPLGLSVHYLYQRLNDPATSLTRGIHGIDFVVFALFACIGSPIVEELYFRGLVFRSLLGLTRSWERHVRVLGPVLLSAALFGIVHFQPIELPGLAAFGVVLALLAYRTGRLGPGLIAHITFNASTIISLSRTH